MSTAMDLSTDTSLSKLVSLIVETVQPEKVILFGSRSRGTARSDSDYDFLVIKSGIVNEREVTRAIYQSLFHFPDRVSVDVVAVDSVKFEKSRDILGLVYREADREGVVVYG